MLEGRQLILATNQFAKEDRKKSWFYLISTLLVLGICYAGVVFIPYFIVRLLFAILIGLTIVRLFIIYHDYLHHSILQNSVLAKIIFTVYGWYILAPVSIWKRSHDYHHAHNSKLYTSSIGSFPVVTKDKFFSSPKSERFMYMFIRHPFTIAFGYIFAFIIGMCLRSATSSLSKHWDSIVALVFHFTIGTLMFYFGGWQIGVCAFLIPALLSSAMGSYLFYAQHNFPDVVYEEKEGWTYIGAALNSSSYMDLNPVMHWFTGNIGYHHIHHTNPRIPFYRLPEVYQNIKEFQNAKKTSLGIRDIMKCLQLKVWDPEKRRMLTKKELYA